MAEANPGPQGGGRFAPDRPVPQVPQMVDHPVQHPMALGAHRLPVGRIEVRPVEGARRLFRIRSGG